MSSEREAAPEIAPRRTVKLVLEYDGTDFRGWQRQSEDRTVQQTLEEALAAQLSEKVSVVGAGRTDSGVHAAGQVASFRTTCTIPPEGIAFGTNSRLPRDVAVLSAADVPPDFHAQRSATRKHYRYSILNRRVRSPLAGRTALEVAAPLDDARMVEAAAHLIGRHDYTSFRNAGSVETSPVRTVSRLDITRSGEYLAIDVEGDGFLYKMVRNLVGTLMMVGVGKLTPVEAGWILEQRDRRRAGPAAPAHGLCLVEVSY